MHSTRRLNHIALILLSLVALLSIACDGSKPEADRPVQLALNWFPEAEHGGYYAAQVHGDYSRSGVEIEILGGGLTHPS